MLITTPIINVQYGCLIIKLHTPLILLSFGLSLDHGEASGDHVRPEIKIFCPWCDYESSSIYIGRLHLDIMFHLHEVHPDEEGLEIESIGDVLGN